MMRAHVGSRNMRSAKLLLWLWISIPVGILAGSIFGWSIGDLRGGLLLSFLPVSFLAVTGVIAAAIAKSAVSRFSKWIWIATSVAALLAAMIFADRPLPEASKGADTILAYVMLTLSFPIALVVPLALVFVSPFWEGRGTFVQLAAMWFCFFVAGYAQWFVLLPWLRRWWERSRLARSI